MKHIAKVLIALIFVTVNYGSGMDSLITKGLRHSYSFEFDQADSIFNEIITTFPNRPEGYHYLSQLHLWYFLGSSDLTEFAIFEQYNKRVIEMCEAGLEEDEETSTKYILASANRSLGMAEVLRGNSMSAFWAIKDAKNLYDEVIDEDPQYFDAYTGLGVINYAISFVPGYLKFFMSIVGLSVDREEGIEQLRKASRIAQDTKVEASLYLARAYTDYSGRYEDAASILKGEIAEHPKNLLLHHQYIQTKLYSRKIDEAMDAIKEAEKVLHPKFATTSAFVSYFKGELYFYRNRYDEAIKNLTDFLKETPTLNYTGYANYMIALCFKQKGDELNYKHYMLNARHGSDEIEEDIYAREMSRIFFNKEFSENELTVLEAYNLLKAGEYESVIEMTAPVKDELDEREFTGLANLVYAEALLETGNHGKVNGYLNEVVEIDYRYNKWIVSYGYTLLAKLSFRMGNAEKGREYLEEAEDENEWGLQREISAKVNRIKFLRKNITK